MKLHFTTQKHTSYVELKKNESNSFGIAVADFQKEDKRPVIKSVKHGGVAYKSHCLAEGDEVLSMNGRDSKEISKKEAKRLLKESSALGINVEYNIRQPSFDYSRISCCQRMFITLRKESGSFGFVMRKSGTTRARSSEYPTISNIKRGGPAHKEGSLMAGDRLLEVDNQSLSWCTLAEANQLLHNKDEAVFLIEYLVGIVDLSRENKVEAEIDCRNFHLGMVLSSDGDKMTISTIQQASLAQRCGIFHVGDEILTINGIEAKNLSASKANDLIRRFKKNPGNLTLVHKNGKITHESDKDSSSKMESCAVAPSTEIESLSTVLSSIIRVPQNSPVSFYHDQLSVETFFESASDFSNYDNCQMKTISILREINCTAKSLLTHTRTNLFDDDVDDNSSQQPTSANCNRHEQLSKVKKQIFSINKLTKDLSIHVMKYIAQTEHYLQNNLPSKSVLDTTNILQDNGVSMEDLIDSLHEISKKRFMSKRNVEAFLETVSKMSPNCVECNKRYYIVLFALKKVVLLLSLSLPIRDGSVLVRQVLDNVTEFTFPCEICKNLIKPTSTSVDSLNDKNSLLNMPRVGGVGASASSFENAFSKYDLKSKRELKVGLDVPKQTAVYKLVDITSDDTDNEEYFLNSLCSETSEYYKESTYSLLSNVDISLSSSNLQTGTNSTHSKLTTQLEHLRTSPENKTKNRSDFETFQNDVKSAEASSNTETGAFSFGPSVRPKTTFPKGKFSRSRSPTRRHAESEKSCNFEKNKNTFRSIENLNSCCDQSAKSQDSTYDNTVKTCTQNVVLKADSKKSFGIALGYDDLFKDETKSVPIITSIKPDGPAYKTGVLQKGDRILAMNGLSTVGITVRELETMKRQLFSFDEIVLHVEFDIRVVNKQYGEFTLSLEDSVTLGLKMEKSPNNSIVKGIVKGSVAHRSGQVFPKDQILSLKVLREDNLDVLSGKNDVTKVFKLVIRRDPNGPCYVYSTTSDVPFPTKSYIEKGSDFVIKHSSIRKLVGSDGRDKTVLEHDFTLYRDPILWDFGFLFGENPRTGKAYVTDIREDGPADHCKVLQKDDRILQVNGVLVDRTSDNSIAALFCKTTDEVDLLTRRVLSFK